MTSAFSNAPHLARELSVAMYVAHTKAGRSLRWIARQTGINPSTVLRRIRKIEDCRDDPLIDRALRELTVWQSQNITPKQDCSPMNSQTSITHSAQKLTKQEIRILRRMAETGAFLAIGQNVAKGVVFRQIDDQKPTKMAVVSKNLAQKLVLRDFIRLDKKQELLSTYQITSVGNAALKRAMIRGGWGYFWRSTPRLGRAGDWRYTNGSQTAATGEFA